MQQISVEVTQVSFQQSISTRNTVAAASAKFACTDKAGAHLALDSWHSASVVGSFAYSDVPGYRVTAGAPRCSPENLAALFYRFSEDCASLGRRRVHFGLPGSALEFLESRHGHVHVGDLPLFDLERWRDPATVPPGIRAQAHRARRHGVTVRLLSAPPADSSALIACRDAWLREKPLPPMRFMTTPFLFDSWPEQGVFVAEREGKIVGFLTSSQVLFGDILRVDMVGRVPWAPNGCVELLVAEAFRRAAERGVVRATLGLAPLSRRSGTRHPGAAWTALARRLASPLYSFEGLEAFKAKFVPDAWVPLYCVAPGPRFTARDALAVARAFAGGSVLRYAAQSVMWGMGERLTPTSTPR